MRPGPDLDERTARAAWSRLVEPGDQVVTRVLERLGATAALRALATEPDRLAGLAGTERVRGDVTVARWRARVADVDPRRDLATVARFGGRLIIPADPEWPPALNQLGDRIPVALWARGPLELRGACERSAAMVGSRTCSSYGEHVARELAAGCADRQVSVISGAAYGIDALCHRGALAVRGATVAVLACGVDRPYPRGNEQLIERIAAEGLVVSEVAPGSAPTRWRFVQRNRLIAAATRATVVVEAAWRSGAMITAREAGDLGREVGAVPGPVTSPMSAGCHRLLREGATCVTDAAEIVELVAAIGEQLPLPPAVPRAAHDGLDPVDLRVFDALPLHRAVTLEAVARTAGLDAGSVRAAVGRLQLAGLAVGGTSGWQRAAQPSPPPPILGRGRRVPGERPLR